LDRVTIDRFLTPDALLRRIILRSLYCVALAAPLLAVAHFAAPSEAALVPDNFVVESPSPSLSFVVPTCLAFMPDGRFLVGEKRGRAYLVSRSGTKVLLWNAENEIHDLQDCGLMSVAVDPDFAVNRAIYFLYTVDPDSSSGTAVGNGFGRLVRYTMSANDSSQIDPTSRTILLGFDWAHGPITDHQIHTVGSLRFGADGSLLVSIGDGASAGPVDTGASDSAAFGPGRTDTLENIGAFRAQYLASLCGKILRLDPATGHGLSDNPYYDGDPTSVRSRVWQYGLRNPFRFSPRPGTGNANPESRHPGTLYIGDVGWLTWEEIDISRNGGDNFGWPCHEGPAPHSGYQNARPARAGCATMGTLENPGPNVLPVLSWHHTDSTQSTPPLVNGNCVIGGVFYQGVEYPAQYRNRYFFADFGAGWLRVATVDSLDHVTAVESFGTGMSGPVDFATHPLSGDLYYVSIMMGRVFRIRYTEPNLPPVAVASATPDSGRAPLTIAFSSAGSLDPENKPLAHAWSFGDGESSSEPNPTHTFLAGGTYFTVLTVTDTLGRTASDTTRVRIAGPGAFPVTAVLDRFDRPPGPVASSWADNVAALVIADSALTQSGPPSPSAVWSANPFGPDQEVYLTLKRIAEGCRRYSLMLKVQGTSFSQGGIEVRYDQTTATVEVSTQQPGDGWRQRGVLTPVSYAPGDVFGARAYRDGTVQVFRNHTRVGEVSLGNWAFRAGVGRVGINLSGATGSRLEDFGGGSFFAGLNTPPTARIDSPPAAGFFVDGDTVTLRSSSLDVEEDAAGLSTLWQVDLIHNNHTHPAVFTSTSPEDIFIAGTHDDGTGVRYVARLFMTDSGGMRDTAEALLYPDVDLSIGPASVAPEPARAGAPATLRFMLRNTGRMWSPPSFWLVTWDADILAEGKTAAVAAGDSAVIEVSMPAGMQVGLHDVGIVADVFDGVFEHDEINNSWDGVVVVVAEGTDAVPPVFLELPSAEPHPTFAWIRWRTDEFAAGVVHYGPGSTPGASFMITEPDTGQTVRLERLAPGTSYAYRVTAIDSSGNSVHSEVGTFATPLDPLSAGDPPPAVLALSNAVPNPSTGQVALALALPRRSRVCFEVYDLLGREVWRAADTAYDAGRWSLRWTGRTLAGTLVAPGVYLARVETEGRTFHRRIAILR